MSQHWCAHQTILTISLCVNLPPAQASRHAVSYDCVDYSKYNLDQDLRDLRMTTLVERIGLRCEEELGNLQLKASSSLGISHSQPHGFLGFCKELFLY